MRPTLSAVVVALVLLTAAFLLIVPVQERAVSNPALTSTGLRTEVAPTYHVVLTIGTEPVLPGYHDTLYYSVLNDTNEAPMSGLSTITILGSYYNTGDVAHFTLPGTPINVSTAPVGSWDFVVPANASATPGFQPIITVWVNSTALKMSQDYSAPVDVGSLELTDWSVCPAVGFCGDLTAGSPATVSVTAEVHSASTGDYSPAANETVKFVFFSTGSSPVPVPGVPASVTTDGLGDAAVTFTPSSSSFNVPGPDHVEIEVTDSVNSTLTIDQTVPFHLYNPVGTTNFAFWLNEPEYYSGENVVAAWQWDGTNTTVGTLNVTNYMVFDDDTDNVIASGVVDSTLPSGSFTFALPTTYSGDFTVEALAHNGSDFWIWSASAEASTYIFGFLASEYYFNPGDTITITVVADGPALAGATIAAYVQASNSGQTLFNGTVTSDSFQFTVPKVAPAHEYDIVAWAYSATAGTIATYSDHVTEASGYQLLLGVSTVSAYSDGSFSPGQTIQVSYTVSTYGTSTLPAFVVLYAFPLGATGATPALKSWAVSASSGSVPFTIPSGTPNGPQTYEIEAEFESSIGFVEVGNLFTVVVNSSPSALNYELVGGSGFTVGWLILLILIIVVALIIVATRRRGRSGRMVMSPAPTSPSGAPEWKEPQQTGGGSSGGTSPPAAPPSGSQ